jgi:hypothetical protein
MTLTKRSNMLFLKRLKDKGETVMLHDKDVDILMDEEEKDAIEEAEKEM